MIREAIEAVLSIGLGLVFLASAVPKLRRPKSFLLTVLQYDILPEWAARPFARTLPPVELSVGLLLVTGTLTRLAAAAAFALLLVFMVGVSVNLVRGRDLDCGCFGGSGRKIGPGILAQEVGLAVGAGVVCVLGGEWTVGGPLLGMSLPNWYVPLALACVGAAAVVSMALGRQERRWRQARMGWSESGAVRPEGR